MRVPDEVKKCVVFLGVERPTASNSTSIVYGGTGFFVATSSSVVKDLPFIHLVTAKHVAEKLVKPPVFIRANSKEGKAIDLRIETTVKWWYHPTDEAADVAILPLTPPLNLLEYKILPTTMFLTAEVIKEKGIGVGDEIFITGLFALHAGTEKNLPIIRTGNIAMIPDERIPVRNFGQMEAYLIEARSIGGLSGSPVFVRQLVIGPAPFYLMGLIHGHWDLSPESIIDSIAPDTGIKAGINVGIAIVTPAQKIMETLNHPGLVAERAKIEATRMAEMSAHNL